MARILQDIVEAFLWPPGSLILVLLLSSLLIAFLRRRRLPQVLLLCFSALVLYMFSTEVLASALLKNLEDRYPHYEISKEGVQSLVQQSAEQNGEIASLIVVLGGGTVPASPDGIGISPDAISRLSGAFLLHRLTGFPLAISGGVVRNRENAVSEADLAAKWLIAAGVPEDKIMIENSSTTTSENAANVIRMLRNEYPQPQLIIVTSAYHMPRSMYSFSAYSGEIVPVSVDYKAARSNMIVKSFLPNITSLRNSTIALREYLGLMVYALMSS